jgi:hypothetical protein
MIDAIQRNVTWRAIPLAGIAGGTVLLIANFILSPLLYDISGTLLLKYNAGLVLGTEALTDDGIGVLIVGAIVHYLFSILFALIIAIVVHRWGLLVGIIGGAILGLALYGINLYTMTAFVEWFFAIHSTAFALSHVLYGATVGGVYESFDHFDVDYVLKENAVNA